MKPVRTEEGKIMQPHDIGHKQKIKFTHMQTIQKNKRVKTEEKGQKGSFTNKWQIF